MDLEALRLGAQVVKDALTEAPAAESALFHETGLVGPHLAGNAGGLAESFAKLDPSTLQIPGEGPIPYSGDLSPLSHEYAHLPVGPEGWNLTSLLSPGAPIETSQSLPFSKVLSHEGRHLLDVEPTPLIAPKPNLQALYGYYDPFEKQPIKL